MEENRQKHQAELISPETDSLEKLVADGRSTPGAPQANATSVVLRKPVPPAAPKGKKKAD